jgi:hypothetical protein
MAKQNDMPDEEPLYESGRALEAAMRDADILLRKLSY